MPDLRRLGPISAAVALAGPLTVSRRLAALLMWLLNPERLPVVDPAGRVLGDAASLAELSMVGP